MLPQAIMVCGKVATSLVTWQKDDCFEFLCLQTAAVHRDLLLELINVPLAPLRPLRRQLRGLLEQSAGQMTRSFLREKRFPYFRFPALLESISALEYGSRREWPAVNVSSVRQVVIVIDDVGGGGVPAMLVAQSFFGWILLAAATVMVGCSVDIVWLVVVMPQSFW